jgi:hypothetical protein
MTGGKVNSTENILVITEAGTDTFLIATGPYPE